MTAVNHDSPDRPDHVAYLLYMATRRMRADGEQLVTGAAARLQPAQLRLLDLIPDGGARVSELAQLTRISKQGLGQLVNQLAYGGYIEVSQDPADRRAKLISRTASGDQARSEVRAILAAIEGHWRAEVGAERYAVFREVLAELALAPSPWHG